jgi:GNAT superfamily N-acetyltransferase
LERPDLDQRVRGLAASVFPEYNLHGDVVGRYWPRLWAILPIFNSCFTTTCRTRCSGRHTIPCYWDGPIDGLPDGIDRVLEHGFGLQAAVTKANALSALLIVIVPNHQARGLSRVMIEGMRSMARERGFESLIAPVQR